MYPEGAFKNGIGNWLSGEGMSLVPRKHPPPGGRNCPLNALPLVLVLAVQMIGFLLPIFLTEPWDQCRAGLSLGAGVFGI